MRSKPARYGSSVIQRRWHETEHRLRFRLVCWLLIDSGFCPNATDVPRLRAVRLAVVLARVLGDEHELENTVVIDAARDAVLAVEALHGRRDLLRGLRVDLAALRGDTDHLRNG